VTVREPALLFRIIIGGTAGELCISHAMKSLDVITGFHPSSLFRFFLKATRVPSMWLGIALMTVAFFSLLAMLSIQEVSFVVPVTALSYLTGAIGATTFLGERINQQRWLGLLMVCLGVTVVWLSKH
jgi:drug/metabolite transporter (DMT)-like permease